MQKYLIVFLYLRSVENMAFYIQQIKKYAKICFNKILKMCIEFSKNFKNLSIDYKQLKNYAF